MAEALLKPEGLQGDWGAPVGVSPYVQVEGFVEEGVQLVPLALGAPSHHLGELVPGLQGELHEGVAGAWWGAAISPIPWPLCPNRGGLGHTGVAAGGAQGSLTTTPSPARAPGGCGASLILPAEWPGWLQEQ